MNEFKTPAHEPRTHVPSDENTHCAFFYGTLMVPDVFYSVCYGTVEVPAAVMKLHTFTPAILKGYCRRRVRDANYPGITEDPDHEVLGTFATGLTKANLRKLDDFEGDDYVRKEVRVKLLTKIGGDAKGEGNVEGEERLAKAYVLLDKTQMEECEWDFDEFRKRKLKYWTRAGVIFKDCDPDRLAQS